RARPECDHRHAVDADCAAQGGRLRLAAGGSRAQRRADPRPGSGALPAARHLQRPSRADGTTSRHRGRGLPRGRRLARAPPAARALAWLYSPRALREPLATLFALEREIGESLRPGLDTQLAHARLAWWREECERSTQARPSHPLTRELGALFAASGLAPPAGLAGLVDIAVWDLAAATFGTRRELEGYCERWSAAMIEPAVQLAAPAAAA